jgi:ubiquinone/menaquinone biosynthesis C-methylase UbiE
MLAESWDLLRGDTSGWSDRPYFREIVLNDGQPALDVGCGTGRLLLDYMGDGLDIDGVDVSVEMLDICRRKAKELGLTPTLYEQSMEDLDLPRRYRTIIVPSASFQLVTDLEDASIALSKFHQHLVPGGILAMSIMDISHKKPIEWKLLVEKTRPEDDVTVKKWWRSIFDWETNLQHTEDRYELVQNDEVIYSELHTWSPATRNYNQAKIKDMLVDAGFETVHAVVDYSKKTASPEEEDFVVLGTRSSE